MAPHDSDSPATLWGRRKLALLTGLATLVVLAGALGSLLTSAFQPARTLAAPRPTGDRASPVAAAQIPEGFSSPVPAVPSLHVPPVEVAVPVISVRSRLVGLRLNPDGTLQVPTDYGVAGWFSDGSAPGDKGAPAVIVGHVDSKAGPGIFFRLTELRAGDAVLIRRADGTDLRFTVYRSATYAKDAFPAAQVYAPQPTPELRLITCTGTFNRTTGHYESNRVVYARLAPAAGVTGSSEPTPTPTVRR